MVKCTKSLVRLLQVVTGVAFPPPDLSLKPTLNILTLGKRTATAKQHVERAQ